MGSDFDYPPNGDFESWGSLLEKKRTSKCGDHSWHRSSHHVGRGLYNSMKRISASRALQDFLAHRSKLSHYFSKRPEGLTVLILCLVLFILGLVMVFLLRHDKSRNRLSNLTLGYFKERSRPRCHEVRKGKKTRILSLGIMFAVGIFTPSIFLFYLGNQMLDGSFYTNCMLWLQVEGHFSGVSHLPKPKNRIDSLVSLWDGTIQVHRQLKDLDPKVTVGDENPVLKKSLAGYADLKRDLGAKALELDSIGIRGKDLTSQHDFYLEKFDNLTRDKYYKADTTYSSYRPGLKRIIPLKADTLVTELDNTMQASWSAIENLLDKYLGTESFLMRKAKQSVVDSLRTVSEIDASIAAITRQFDDMLPKLRSLLQLTSALVFLLAIALLVYPIYLCYTFFQLDRRLKNDIFPDKRYRRLWDISFVSAGGLAAASALMFGVLYLVALVANDACEALERGLFIEGDWAMLGDKVLKPDPFTSDMRTDMNLVLNTCIREDGDGNLATALHLDGRIADLAHDVDVAKDDIQDTREGLLQRDERLARVRVLGFAFQEAVKAQYKAIQVDLNNKPAYWYNETMMFSWDNKDYKTEFHNHLPVIVLEAPYSVGNPAFGLAPLLTDRKYQFNYPISSYNEAIDYLNNRTREWLEIQGITEIPTYCVKTMKGSRYNHPCAHDTKAILISGDMENKAIDALVEKGLGSGISDSLEKEKRRTLMRDIRDHEFIASQIVHSNGVVTCPNNASSCSWNEARLEATDKFLVWEKELTEKTAEAFHFVDKFVDEVVIKEMVSLVEEANSITDRANCQFEGTALRLAVQPLCHATVPGTGVAAITCGIVSVLMTLMCSYVWVWFHYMKDLAAHYSDNEELYYQPGFNSMSNRKEFVSYTGLPSSPKNATPESINAVKQ